MRQMRFRSVGECMAELQRTEQGLFSLGFGGDTLNTSWYVRALAVPRELEVEYITGLGADPLSQDLAAFLKQHDIGSRFIKSVPDRNIGLYLITLNHGERSFTYWRNNSAARLLAADAHHLSLSFAGADAIYLSGITLAILSSQHREILFHHLRQKKRDASVIAFDSNARPKLWASQQEMREVMIAAYEVATVALPTFTDEQQLFSDASAQDCAKRIADYGVTEVIVKDGSNESCALCQGVMSQSAPSPVPTLIDTTGAGDSFNAGYLVARLAGRSIPAAMDLGHRVAGRVIQNRGALAPMALFEDLHVDFGP